MTKVSLSRAEKIQKILENRGPIASQTSRSISHLTTLEGVLLSLQQFLPKIQSRSDDGITKDTLSSLQKELQTFLGDAGSIRKSLIDLKQLYARFNRPTLNIGIVGNARNGKSTFLQSLTGLSDHEIPSSDRGHCTGSPSIVINHDSPETYAELEFFGQDEFMRDVILPYFEELGLEPKPKSFQEFCKNALPPLQLEKPNVTKEGLYKRLRIRHEKKHLYEHDLNSAGRRIEKDKIREYIAQNDARNNELYKWIAVKMATIYCHFPRHASEIGNVSVCDTPGLGDFVCGAEEKLVHTIGDNLEAVFLLKRITSSPDSYNIRPDDTNLYDLIPKSISEFPPNEWSYYIVNYSDDAVGHIEYFKTQLESHSIRTRQIVQVNCRNQADVLQAFDKILDDIADNQSYLDEKLYKSRFRAVEEVLRGILEFTQKLKNTVSQAIPIEDNAGVLWNLFEECWKKVESEVEKIAADRRKPYEDQQNDKKVAPPTTGPKTYIEQKTIHNGQETLTKSVRGPAGFTRDTPKQESRPKVPVTTDKAITDFVQKLESIRKELLERDLFSQVRSEDYAGRMLASFMADRAQLLRVEMSIEFDKLNEELVADCREIRRKIWNILSGNKVGRLGRVIEIDPRSRERGDEPADIWLEELAKTWEGLDGGERIQRALRRLLDTTISFRGYLLPRVRKQLLPLSENAEDDGMLARFTRVLKSDNNLKWEQVRENLETAWKKAANDCCDELLEIANELELAKIAVIEDFCDNFFRAYGHDKTEKYWYNFYHQNRHKIWNEKFAQLLENKVMFEECNAMIDKIRNEIEQLNR